MKTYPFIVSILFFLSAGFNSIGSSSFPNEEIIKNLIKQKKYKRAIQLLNNDLNKVYHPNVYALWAQTASHIKEISCEKQYSIIKEGLKKFPKDDRLFTSYASVLSKDSIFDSSIIYLKSGLRYCSDRFRRSIIYLKLSYSYSALSMNKEAHKTYKQACLLNPAIHELKVKKDINETCPKPYYGGDNIEASSSTHPEIEKRIEALEQIIKDNNL
jgi:tetratricopeptide (TPR) repeat protein